MIDICEDDVKTLRNAIQKVLKEGGVEDAELFSHIEVTRILLESSIYHFEEIMNDCTNKFLSANSKEMKGLELRKIFVEFNIENIFKEWDTMCDLIYDSKKIAIDLNKETISNAFNNIADKFARGEYIDACLEVAKREYPEFSNAKVIREE
ncbi:hypothetical protein SAMN04487851_11471 [Prevotella sp. tc2-28]|uniref:hypothetical protein n=1 Tax=Prevotella sp. tc2-28 TaxID=1761888 RepID=UPI000894BD40|nr:hypothetical protein [Prevotella sp. tc2-28]SEA79951.1 hypothetical protein SAMN04487851_11471 [Prevotella sp. tc2-28]